MTLGPFSDPDDGIPLHLLRPSNPKTQVHNETVAEREVSYERRMKMSDEAYEKDLEARKEVASDAIQQAIQQAQQNVSPGAFCGSMAELAAKQAMGAMSRMQAMLPMAPLPPLPPMSATDVFQSEIKKMRRARVVPHKYPLPAKQSDQSARAHAERQREIAAKQKSDEIVRQAAASQAKRAVRQRADKEEGVDQASMKAYEAQWDRRIRRERRRARWDYFWLPAAALVDSLWRFVDRAARLGQKPEQ